MIARLLILIAIAAVPPLTEDQQAQLAINDDSEQLEGPTLFPLIENVMTWDAQGKDEADAHIPDYDALLSAPAINRGELFLIEGKFAGRARRYGLVQSGQWGDALTEWVLLVQDDPQQVAVVYFVDPSGELAPPHTGSHVRVLARFYKLWHDTDQDGNPTRYLTFIARSPSPATPTPAKPMFLLLPMVGGVLVLVVVYIYVRRLSRSQNDDHPPHSHTPKPPHDVMLSDSANQPLPQDPAEALRQLADQHRDP